MKQDIVLEHEFVEFIPGELKEGTIYVSMRFGTAAHLCVCGCGSKVVTPLRPTDWKLIFDGKTISLDPSIGNWSSACRSHYWIKNNQIRWADQWSKEDIAVGRAYDRRNKDSYFGTAEALPPAGETEGKMAVPEKGLWRKFTKWWHSIT